MGREETMTLIFLAFAAAMLWGVKFHKEGCDGAYLSVEKGRSFRGILALTVMCHHLAERTGDSSPFHIFAFVGFLPVAYFFFLSGYGLQKSYARKPGYRPNILKKRIPSVLIPYLGMTALYWLFSGPYSAGEVLLAAVRGDPIVSFGWYVQFILLVYLGFYLATGLYRGNQLRGVAWNALFLVLCLLVFRALNYEFVWFNSCVTYPLGILWAMTEERCLPWIRRHYWPVTAATTAGFGGAFLAAMLFVDTAAAIPLYWAAGILFTAVCLLLQMKVTFRNRFLLAMGDCSMELYMIHGFFLQLYRGNHIYLENPALWSAAVVASSCLGAWGLHKLFGMLLKGKKKAAVS